MENAPHGLLFLRNRNPGIINGTFDMDFTLKPVIPVQIFNTYMVIFLIFKFCSKVVISVMK